MVLPDEEGPYSLERSTLIFKNITIETYLNVFHGLSFECAEQVGGNPRLAAIASPPLTFVQTGTSTVVPTAQRSGITTQVRSNGDVDDDYIFRRMSAIGYSRFWLKRPRRQ